MKTRALATSATAAAAALCLTLTPATASTTTTTSTDSFGSSGGLSPQGDRVAAKLPHRATTQLPTEQAPAAQQRSAGIAAAPTTDLLTRYYVRGYQTLYDPYSIVLGDVDVADEVSDSCIVSNMNVNGTDRADPALTFAGAYDPADPIASGGPVVPSTYGAATYRFGPHFFYSPGADGECYTDDDEYDGLVDNTPSNALRIRYASKGIVKYSKSGSRKKIHVLAQRYDKSEKYVGLYSVKVQYRKAGTTSWKTKKTMVLDKTGRGDYLFSSSAKYYYRIAVSLTDNVQSSYSPQTYM